MFRGEYHKEDGSIIAVAIKRLPNLPYNESKTMDFNREVNIMRRLDHPNIVKIINFVPDPVAIIMEYMRYTSFDKYLSYYKPNLTTQVLLKFAKNIANVSIMLYL